MCIVDYFNTISTTRCLDLREASQNGKWSRNEAKKAILAGCKYFLQVIMNLYPSGCPDKSCYSIIHDLFGYLSSFKSRCSHSFREQLQLSIQYNGDLNFCFHK